MSTMMRHFEGWSALAATHDVRAFDVLAGSFASLKEPREQRQYLLAMVFASHFRDQKFVPQLERFLRSRADDHDAWLWYVGTGLMRGVPSSSPLARWELAKGQRSAWIRAATLLSNSHWLPDSVLSLGRGWKPGYGDLHEDLVGAVLATLPARGVERGLLLAGVSELMAAPAEFAQDVRRQEVARRLLRLVEEPATPEWASLQVLRDVSRALGLPHATEDVGALRRALDGLGAPAGRYARPKFAGIEASGRRICYVIDMSDSMLKPVTEADRQGLKPPITGGEAPASPDDGLPWESIRTRFDLARELLKASLASLDPSRSFAVVAFGDSADLLEGSPGMIPASSAAVRRVMAELDRLRPGPPTATRDLGTLRGETNLHYALERAFAVVRNGFSKGEHYCSEQSLREGCDTLYLLSDGEPTRDNFGGTDPGFT